VKDGFEFKDLKKALGIENAHPIVDGLCEQLWSLFIENDEYDDYEEFVEYLHNEYYVDREMCGVPMERIKELIGNGYTVMMCKLSSENYENLMNLYIYENGIDIESEDIIVKTVW